jgi:ArsR family transcriptional regulator, arsenate/arsenite/antimonite-responsive transcriptional repressor
VLDLGPDSGRVRVVPTNTTGPRKAMGVDMTDDRVTRATKRVDTDPRNRGAGCATVGHAECRRHRCLRRGAIQEDDDVAGVQDTGLVDIRVEHRHPLRASRGAGSDLAELPDIADLPDAVLEDTLSALASKVYSPHPCEETHRMKRSCRDGLDELLVAGFFKALADPRRLQIVSELAGSDGCRTVGSVASCCPIDQSVVSRHLAILRQAGIVNAERNGKKVLYTLDTGTLADRLRALADALDATPAAQEK